MRVSDYREEMGKPAPRFADLTWGLQKIQADSVWAMGYTGQDVVIGGQDTGYEWDHPALVGTYRGSTNGQVDHNYNWQVHAIHQLNPINGDTTNNPLNNPCGLDSPVPCDDNNHGRIPWARWQASIVPCRSVWHRMPDGLAAEIWNAAGAPLQRILNVLNGL